MKLEHGVMRPGSKRKTRLFLWPIVGRLARKWDENELIVEPGERHSETFEFIIDKAGVYIDPDRPLRTVLNLYLLQERGTTK